MNISELLRSDIFDGLLSKLGVSGEQGTQVAQQAMEAITSKFSTNPSQLVSLLSPATNSAEDNAMADDIGGDLVSRLVEKVGISPDIAQHAKAFVPDLLSKFTGKLNDSGANNEAGIASLLGSAGDSLGDLGGVADKAKGLLNKFF